MSRIVIDLFVEDRAHEEFLKNMLARLAKEAQRETTIRIRSARGGHGRVLEELSLYQKGVQKGLAGMTMPDLLVVAADTNCSKFNKAIKAIREKLDSLFKDRTVVACPDPHIERWYLADPESFSRVVGVAPKVGKKKCERDYYKASLAKAVGEGGHPPTLGGIEFAREIVDAMDLYRAGKIEKSLKHFLDKAKAQLRSS